MLKHTVFEIFRFKVKIATGKVWIYKKNQIKLAFFNFKFSIYFFLMVLFRMLDIPVRCDCLNGA